MKKILLLTLLALCVPVIVNASVASYGFSASETEKNEKDATAPKDEMPTDNDLESMSQSLFNSLSECSSLLQLLREKAIEYHEDDLLNSIEELSIDRERIMMDIYINYDSMEGLEYCGYQINNLWAELLYLFDYMNDMYANNSMADPTVFVAEGIGMTFKIKSIWPMTVQVGTGNTPAISKGTKGAITIPAEVNGYKVVDISYAAFYECRGLTSVIIPNSVTSIGTYAFSGCSGLTSIIISNSVTCIESRTFKGCSSLTSVTIPNSVTSIGEEAFYGCGLSSITIGSGMKRIGYDAFEHCSSLTKVIVPDLATWCGIDFISNPLLYAEHIYSDEETEITNLVIPEVVTTINRIAFINCKSLTSVTIPNSVTTIEDYAFYDCSGLTSAIIPESVTTLADNAFGGCYFVNDSFINNSALTNSNNWGATLCCEETSDGLLITDGTLIRCRPRATSITIPERVTSIRERAFESCIGLTSVTIGSGVTYIGEYAFYNCNSLQKVIVPDIAAWCGILFDGYGYANPLYYAAHIFSDENTEIIDLTIPDGVTAISDYAFSCCSGLTSVTIPNSVTNIGARAFSSCSGLTSVTIGSGVTCISNDAFGNCSGLTDVFCLAEEVSEANYYAFRNSPIESATLHVPAGSIESYKATSPWSGFGNIVPLTDEDGINEIKNEELKRKKDEAVYDLSGRKVNAEGNSSLKKGINIIRHSDGTTRKVLMK